jgi:thiol-disulfide isomerase/thioredoxin
VLFRFYLPSNRQRDILNFAVCGLSHLTSVMLAMAGSLRASKHTKKLFSFSLLSFWFLTSPGFSQEIQWIRDYEEGIRLARESYLPVLIDFWSEWCLPCREMDKQLFADPGIIGTSGRIVYIRVDIDKDRETPSRFAVTSVPMKLIVDPWQTVLLRMKGKTQVSELLEAIKTIPADFEPLSVSFRALDENPTDHKALRHIGAFYKTAGFAEPAEAFFSRAEKAERGEVAAVVRDPSQAAPALPAASSGQVVETIPSVLPRQIAVPPGAVSTPIVDLSIADLRKKYPEDLKDIELAANQGELNPILEKVGQNVEAFLRNLPNTVAKEQIRQERLAGGGENTVHIEQKVEYLLIIHRSAMTIEWEEDRTNDKGKTVKLKRLSGASLLTSGYPLECMIFSTPFQRAARFLYLGRQSAEPRCHLILFAQRPEIGALPGIFRINDTLINLQSQGLIWVDPGTYQIVRMKSDLLEPPTRFGLHRQTSDITYSEVSFSNADLSLWLPREVVVTIELGGRIFRNLHRYSDYRLFTVQSFEKREPVLPPHPLK